MNIQQKAKFHRALGEPVRLKMLSYLLSKGGCTCICHLAKHIGRDQSVAFRHIEILRQAGIVRTHKEGPFLMCCVANKKKLKSYLER
jgi:DNA-binding transcriptional ArsR family regulator